MTSNRGHGAFCVSGAGAEGETPPAAWHLVSRIKRFMAAMARRPWPRSRCAATASALRKPCFQVARRHRSKPSGV